MSLLLNTINKYTYIYIYARVCVYVYVILFSIYKFTIFPENMCLYVFMILRIKNILSLFCALSGALKKGLIFKSHWKQLKTSKG